MRSFTSVFNCRLGSPALDNFGTWCEGTSRRLLRLLWADVLQTDTSTKNRHSIHVEFRHGFAGAGGYTVLRHIGEPHRLRLRLSIVVRGGVVLLVARQSESGQSPVVFPLQWRAHTAGRTHASASAHTSTGAHAALCGANLCPPF